MACDGSCGNAPAFSGVTIGGVAPPLNADGYQEIACPDDAAPDVTPAFEDSCSCKIATKRLGGFCRDGELLLGDDGQPKQFWSLVEVDGICKWCLDIDKICVVNDVHRYGYSGTSADNLAGLSDGDTDEYPGSLTVESECDTVVQITGSHDINPDADAADYTIQVMSPTATGGAWQNVGVGSATACCPGDTRVPVAGCYAVDAGVTEFFYRVEIGDIEGGSQLGGDAYSQISVCATVARLECA